MSKQVEVPEEIGEELARSRWERAWPDTPWDSIDPDATGVRQAAHADLHAVLPLIYKHFSDRLLFELKYETEPYTIEQIEAAALQDASIPKSCKCSYDRLVTREQAFAIRASCPVHGPTAKGEEAPNA